MRVQVFLTIALVAAMLTVAIESVSITQAKAGTTIEKIEKPRTFQLIR